MNLVGYTGNLTADVELKQTQQGTSVATFTLAVKRPYKKDTTDFFKCVAWRAEAEFISKYFKKGDYIALTGYNTTQSYEKKVGDETVKISTVEFYVEKAGFCGSRGSSESYQTKQEEPKYEEITQDDELPF